ncbi:hypothetical protein FS749_002262 [Ceratobasidium sp. UAMH 11750]|nr:hypothetical protein FS749_002262 [Ceratobasidium sp. UAMH 11750]
MDAPVQNRPDSPDPNRTSVVHSRLNSRGSSVQEGLRDEDLSINLDQNPLDPETQRYGLKLQAEVAKQRLEHEDRRHQREFEVRMAQIEVERIRAETTRAQTRVPPQAPATGAAPSSAAPPPQAVAPTPSTTPTFRTKGLQSSLSSMSKLSTHEGYNTWSRKLYQFISSHDLQGYLDGSEPVPNRRDSVATERYRRESNVLSAAISGLLDDSIYPLVAHLGRLPTPMDLWTELERLFRGKDSNQAAALLSELHNTSLADGESPDTWIARVREIYAALKDTQMAQSEFAICQFIIEGLPTSYREVALSLQKEPDANWTIAHFASIIRQHWTFQKRIDSRSGNTTSNSVGAYPALAKGSIMRPPPIKFKANGQRDPNVVAAYGKVCRQCLSVGHDVGSKDCVWFNFRVAAGWQSASYDKSKKKDKGSSKQVNVAEAQERPPTDSTGGSQASSSLNTASPTASSHSEAQAYPAFVQEGGVEVYNDFACGYAATIDCPESILAAAASDVPADDFLLDTGAQIHISCVRESFISLAPLDRPVHIRGIGGNVVVATLHGDIMLPVHTGGSVFWLKLLGVVYAPDLGRNLVGLGRLRRMHRVCLDFETNYLVDRHGQPLVCATFQAGGGSRLPCH